MRKSYLFLASTAILLASCANDELNSDVLPLTTSDTQAIGFNLKTAGMTRATLSGSDAASKLNNEFVVYGTKHSAAEDGSATNDNIAFQNYVVTWTDNTAGTSSSNSSNWEYVGGQPYEASKVSPSLYDKANLKNQSIKYWDYSATNGYTFTAFSGKTLLSTEGAKVEKITTTATDDDTDGTSVYDKGYKVTLPANASLKDIYFSDRVEVAKAKYGQPVVLTFRNFGTKVRVAFYETVPGYSVKDLKFYAPTTNNKTAVTKYNDMRGDAKGAFAAALLHTQASASSNTVTVTYGDGTTQNTGTTATVALNEPKVINSSATQENTLTLGSNIASKTLGTTADNATFDSKNKDYTVVYPNLDNTTPMLIRCDYTLVADDGSDEKIYVKNARVIVPAQYCQWKSNYAYTYLFKISNNTNGITGTDPDKGTNPDNPGIDYDNPGKTDNPEGLFPITFDAVTVEATEDKQETITTIANNSVTAYSVKSDVTTTANSEYKSGNAIYFVDQSTSGDHDVLTVNDIADITGTSESTYANTANVYSLSGITIPTEAQVLAKLTGYENGLKLTAVSGATKEQYVPSQSGPSLDFGKNGAVKFTPSAVGYYAYVYCSEKYVAQKYSAVNTTDTFSDTETYYFKADKTEGSSKADFYYVASNINANNFAEFQTRLYVKDTTQNPAAAAGKYDIKVVLVK